MNLNQLVKGLSGIIPGEISVLDFSIVSKIDQISAKEILNALVANDIGTFDGDTVNFSSGDKLQAALFALKEGAPIEEVSTYLDWKDFEGLTAKVLESKGFSVIRNLVLTKPRMEIDVIGINHGVALLIDCKH